MLKNYLKTNTADMTTFTQEELQCSEERPEYAYDYLNFGNEFKTYASSHQRFQIITHRVVN